jgi:hypothetical protein
MTMLPSLEMESWEDDGSAVIGAARFATHTVVCNEILLYQMPKYQ